MIFKWNLSVINADTRHTINNATQLPRTHSKHLKDNEALEIEDLYSKIYFFSKSWVYRNDIQMNVLVINVDPRHTINMQRADTQ